MRHWQEKEKMIYEGCKGCEYISTCYSGCQMIALAYNGKLGTKVVCWTQFGNKKIHN